MKCSGIDALTGEAVEITAERGAITAVEPLLGRPAGLRWLAPGFIDLQVNGFAGADYCSPETPLESIARSLEAQFATGVTRIFATVITGPREAMLAALANLAQARRQLPFGRAIEAIHVEGPFISPQDGPRGAHPREHVRPPDLDEYRRWQEASEGLVRMVTLSPEWPRARLHRGDHARAWWRRSGTWMRRPRRSTPPSAPARGCPRTSAMGRTPPCPAIPTISGSSWPKTALRLLSSSTAFTLTQASCAWRCAPKASNGAS